MSTSLGAVFLAGRILFAIFFVPLSGVGHIRRGTMMIGYAKSTGMPLPSLAGWPSGVWLIAAACPSRRAADLGALMLGLFVTLAAFQFHRFWAIEDETQRSSQKQSFWRNVALLGACLSLFAVFSAFGKDIPLTITDPLFRLAGSG